MESASKEQQPVQEAIDYCKNPNNDILVDDLEINARLETTKELYDNVNSPEYLNRLVGTIGVDPLYKK